MEKFVEALGARPRAQPELVRETSFLESGGKMLRQRAGDKAPEDVTHNQGPHAAIRLPKRHHAPKPHGCEHLLRHICIGQALGCSVEQRAICWVVQEQAQMLTSGTGGAGRRPAACSAQAPKQHGLRQRAKGVRLVGEHRG